MKINIEVWDDLLQAQARLVELQKPGSGATNAKLLGPCDRFFAQDRRVNLPPPPPPDWERLANLKPLHVIQYEK